MDNSINHIYGIVIEADLKNAKMIRLTITDILGSDKRIGSFVKENHFISVFASFTRQVIDAISISCAAGLTAIIDSFLLFPVKTI